MARMGRTLGWIVLFVHTLVKVITLILAKILKDIFLVYLFFTIEFKNIAPLVEMNCFSPLSSRTPTETGAM
jgi:hypothetical protein